MGTHVRPHAPHHEHAVQFYRDDTSLLATVSRFAREGLTVGQPVVIIATDEHRVGLMRRLVADGVPRDFFERAGALWMLDASETLATFMDGDSPNPQRFN